MTDNRTTSRVQRALDKLQKGDKVAQDELITAAIKRLEKLARAMFHQFGWLRTKEQTGDVLNEAVIRLRQALERTRPKSPRQFFSFAARKIEHVLVDMYRFHRVQKRDGKLVQVPLEEIGVKAKGFRTFENWEAVIVKVEKLPKNQQVVWRFRFILGKSREETAKILGVSIPTVAGRECPWPSNG